MEALDAQRNTFCFPSSSATSASASTSASAAAASLASSLAIVREDTEANFSRRSSLSSVSDYALENDIKSIGDQIKRVLHFCELQSQNPIRLHEKINDLNEQLRLAIVEKNYWMKRYKELAESSVCCGGEQDFSNDIREYFFFWISLFSY